MTPTNTTKTTMLLTLAGLALTLPTLTLPAQADFRSDVALLKGHPGVIVLSDQTGRGEVAVVPAYQGRVMTSTVNGGAGDSFGWLNKKLIAAGKTEPHINAYGGEDRIWFGPEGGQFGLYFKPGAPYDFAHWQTPAPIDSQPWNVTAQTRRSVTFTKTLTLTNHSGTKFHVRALRQVRLLPAAALQSVLGGRLAPGVKAVAYETLNTITNAGPTAWRKASGLPSIWILGMYNPSPTATIVVPFKPGSVAQKGRVANDAYFGKVPADRLKTDTAHGVLFFRADGKRRGKIGIGPNRVLHTLGSYDSARHQLTIVSFSPVQPAAPYVNSMWETQKAPYAGDVANSYNDGPLPTGGQMGPFYELESSSPGAALSPGRSLTHRRITIHLQGPPSALNAVSMKMLGVPLSRITNAFRG